MNLVSITYSAHVTTVALSLPVAVMLVLLLGALFNLLIASARRLRLLGRH